MNKLKFYGYYTQDSHMRYVNKIEKTCVPLLQVIITACNNDFAKNGVNNRGIECPRDCHAKQHDTR